MLTRILSYAAIAASRVFQQFRNSLEVIGLLNVISTQVQAIDDAAVDTAEAIRNPAVAVGVTLDNIGKLEGAPPRGTLTDAEYRTRVLAQALVNRSNGTSSDMLAIIKTLIPAWNQPGDVAQIIEFHGVYPNIGAFEITCVAGVSVASRITVEQAEEAARFLNAGTGAGFRAIIIFRDPSIALNNAFRFAGGSPPETAAGFGVGKFYGARDH